MDRFIRTLLFSLLLLPASHAFAEKSFVISPSVGSASISNIDGYKDSPSLRVDGSFFPLPQIGVNVFAASYPGFHTRGNGNDVNIKISGFGAGVVGRWPVHPNVQPFVRIDRMQWNAKATGLNRTLAEEKGGSTGFAVGAQFPIKRIFGVKAEVSGYNNVSGADIRQFSLGLTIEL